MIMTIEVRTDSYTGYKNDDNNDADESNADNITAQDYAACLGF